MSDTRDGFCDQPDAATEDQLVRHAQGSHRAVEPDACIVCKAVRPRPFALIACRRYWRCDACECTFLDPRLHPARAAELEHYLRHDNDPDDPRYRRFLAKLAVPLLGKLEPGAVGLDYGCGPGPALAEMLREAGHPVALYDPFFAPDRAPLEREYDFVVCTETAEHFHRPAMELDRLDSLLAPGGWLAVMTCFQTDDERFASWHYRRDPTHVVFYRAATFRRLAAVRGWSCEIPVKDVALLGKPAPGGGPHRHASAPRRPEREGAVRVRPTRRRSRSGGGTVAASLREKEDGPMQIQVNTDNQIAGDEALRRRVEAAVEAALARFVDRITRVEVHIGDENSRAKSGSDDKRCSMEARIAGLRPMGVTEHAATVEQAVDGAAEKLEQALERALGRLNDPRNRTLDS